MPSTRSSKQASASASGKDNGKHSSASGKDQSSKKATAPKKPENKNKDAEVSFVPFFI